jgi:hypothetical protein
MNLNWLLSWRMDRMWIVLLISWRVDRWDIREEVAATEYAAVIAAAAVAALDICVHALEALEKPAAVVAATEIAAAAAAVVAVIATVAALDICVHALEIAQDAPEKLAAAAVHFEKLVAADIHAEIAHALDVSGHALAIDPVAASVLAIAVLRVLLLPVPRRALPVQDYRYFVAADTAAADAAALSDSAAGTVADSAVPPDPSMSRWRPSMVRLPERMTIAVGVVVGIAVDREHSFYTDTDS